MTGAAADGAAGRESEEGIRQLVKSPGNKTLTRPLNSRALNAGLRPPFTPVALPGAPVRSSGKARQPESVHVANHCRKPGCVALDPELLRSLREVMQPFFGSTR